MKYSVTKVTTTTTTTSGGKVKTSSQSQSQNKKSPGSQFSIVKTFSSQKPSAGFKDNLFQPSDDSLYSSKQEVQDYQIQRIPKFLREKKKFYFHNLHYLKKKEDIVGVN